MITECGIVTSWQWLKRLAAAQHCGFYTVHWELISCLAQLFCLLYSSVASTLIIYVYQWCFPHGLSSYHNLQNQFVYMTLPVTINALFMEFELLQQLLLSHPGLGWLNVSIHCHHHVSVCHHCCCNNFCFSHQNHFSLTLYIWMTILWALTKCTVVALINKNLVVCMIKWVPLNQSLWNLIAIFPWGCLSLDWVLEEFCWKLCREYFYFRTFYLNALRLSDTYMHQ